MKVADNVLEAIGNTPLVRLQRVAPHGAARVLVKLEWANPTGSMKDRMARAVVEAAEADGRLRPGGTVVEYTGGSTGVSLALVCAAKGYRLEIVTSDAFSEEKIRTMRAFGAHVTVIPSDEGKITGALIREMMDAARRLSVRPGHWWVDQIGNGDAAAGYHPLGEEVWEQTAGEVDVFVHSVGSAHSLRGAAEALRRHKPGLHIAAVEPSESAVLSGGAPGSHKIEGIGIGFVPAHWRGEEVDEILTGSTEEAVRMCRRLAREEGIFAGTSSGLNVVAALRVAGRLGPGATVVTLMVDSGVKYVSAGVYR